MSWFDDLFGGGQGQQPPAAPAKPLYQPPGTVEERMYAWENALNHDGVPAFVEQRLRDAATGKLPWMSTMTPAELRLGRSHGVRPLAMVSGTCWLHYGYSWTKGHAEGWHKALARLRTEARLLGANAVVDVKMRKIELEIGESMDFTLVGTAVRIDGLPPSVDPVVATVPALEFVRLLEVGIVPVGIAIGAHYEWLNNYNAYGLNSRSSYGNSGFGNYNLDAQGSWYNQPLTTLGNFWEGVRRQALRGLHADTVRQGNGVLAHTHFGQIFKSEGGGENVPPQYLGRHIVIGTVIDRRPDISVSLSVRTVVDMRDDESPLLGTRHHGHNAYTVEDEEGAI